MRFASNAGARGIAVMSGVLALLAACAVPGGPGGGSPLTIGATVDRPDVSSGALEDLAATGVVRIGLPYAPAPTTLFVQRGADGLPKGVTADLAADLGRRLGRPVRFVLAPNTGELTDKLEAGEIDVAFMPVDESRRQRIRFGPTYTIGENTYLVRPGSTIQAIEEVDRPGVKVVAVAGTTTIRATSALLKQTTVSAMPGVEQALAAIRSGQADAFALTRDSLLPVVGTVPGARILPGSFRTLSIAVAVPPGRPAGQVFVSGWLSQAKGSGLVRRTFDAHGFTDARVAP